MKTVAINPDGLHPKILFYLHLNVAIVRTPVFSSFHLYYMRMYPLLKKRYHDLVWYLRGLESRRQQRCLSRQKLSPSWSQRKSACIRVSVCVSMGLFSPCFT
jgi:hypothetical protein